MAEPQKIYDATAVSSTTTYKSLISIPEERRTSYQISATGTLTGTLSLEINTLPERDYRAAVVAAGSEAANTTGWVAQDLRMGGENPHVTTATHAVSGAGNLVLYYPPGAYRQRFSYTNATNTGTLNAYRRHI
jgi:hypothetical protein